MASRPFRVFSFKEEDIPDLDNALHGHYDDLSRYSCHVIKAIFNWDRNGWFVAKSGEKKVGFIGGCAMSSTQGGGGLFLVLPEYRRQGVGKALFDARLKYMGQRNICMNSVEKRLDFNRREGFIFNPFDVSLVIADPKEGDINTDVSSTIQTYSPAYLRDLLDYDTKIHTIPRHTFLTHWIGGGTKTFIAMDNGKIGGYGCIQTLPHNLMMIAPLMADNDQIAEDILCCLYREARQRNTKIVMDILKSNQFMIQNFHRFALSVQGTEYRLYNKWTPQLPLEHVYALTTEGISLV